MQNFTDVLLLRIFLTVCNFLIKYVILCFKKSTFFIRNKILYRRNGMEKNYYFFSFRKENVFIELNPKEMKEKLWRNTLLHFVVLPTSMPAILCMRMRLKNYECFWQERSSTCLFHTHNPWWRDGKKYGIRFKVKRIWVIS